MDFNYFTVSEYIVISIATITIPIFVFRLLRIFPMFVKTGSIGNEGNTIMFTTNVFGKKATSETRRKTLYDFVTETHPSTIFMDAFAIAVICFLLFIFWGVIPFVFVIWLVLWSIIKFAKHSRKKYVKKEEFVARLDGTHEETNDGRI